MKNQKIIEWVLRIGVAGEFIGHGVLATLGKPQWIKWIQDMLNVELSTATTLLFIIGLVDIIAAIIILIKPIRLIVLWMILWGFWTALLRPLVGESIWDFVERFANWAAPLALLLIVGWPRKFKEWFK